MCGKHEIAPHLLQDLLEKLSGRCWPRSPGEIVFFRNSGILQNITLPNWFHRRLFRQNLAGIFGNFKLLAFHCHRSKGPQNPVHRLFSTSGPSKWTQYSIKGPQVPQVNFLFTVFSRGWFLKWKQYSIRDPRYLNAFTTGNHFWGQIYLKINIGRDLGALKGFNKLSPGCITPHTLRENECVLQRCLACQIS